MNSKEISINKEKFKVNPEEYKKIVHNEYNNLNILDQLGFHERQISLLKELSKLYENKVNIKLNNVSHGGFIPIKISPFYQNVYINNNPIHSDNIFNNIVNHLKNKNIYYSNYICDKQDLYEINFNNPGYNIIISLNDTSFPNFYKYALSNLSTEWTPQPTLYIYVSNNLNESFIKTFKYYLKDSLLDYDNLIHLCIMVKNGGSQFENMLKKNMDIIDRWTILDTGSTDNTINIINNTLSEKKGDLYQEPFINFKESRNRCLDLAGKDCKFIIMLDDTYIIDGNLREFLNITRGDQTSTSFTLIILSDDTQYGSNRIIKSESNLRYIHKIHEVIEDKNNINVVIPSEKVKIVDGRFDYMEERTMKRKELDLKLLYEELEEDPTNPRTYYYLAQTYNLLGEYEKSYEYFLKRSEFKNSGFIQERIDALFEAARIANFKLNKPWEEFMSLYEKAYKTDESRPESLYFMGINYYLKNEHKKAFYFFKKGFEIGYPIHCQYSLKPTISYHFLPKFLTRLCYTQEDYKLGEKVSLFFLQNNNESSEDYEEIKSYYMIFRKFNEYDPNNYNTYTKYEKPLFVFVADGGFNKWSGSNIMTTGVGGSETYIIEMARYIQKHGKFQVIVFCNCEKEEIFEDVEYKNLSIFSNFVNDNYIHHCMVSRYTEYLPLCFSGKTENVYLVLHDLGPSGNVIPINPKLKQVFCLTEWHVSYFTDRFKQLSHLTVPLYYGIDFTKFKSSQSIQKEPFKFIYSSFPNRGLLPLLKMWPKIYSLNNQTSLHIYSDVNGKWVNETSPEQMKEIKHLLKEYTNLNINYHGWVDKKTLANAWLSSDIWFYPCIFMETFCLTALEAALTKTLVFTNDLAALQNTVEDRGIVIPGNPLEKEWQDKAIEKISLYFSSYSKDNGRHILYNNYRQKNYNWASSLSWENQANKLLEKYVLPNNIFQERIQKGWHGWYNDNLKNVQLFNMMLNYFRITHEEQKEPCKILEIGVHTGISLINIMKQIPKSIGYGIDKWDMKEIQESFTHNIIQSSLENKIISLQGESHEVLTSMIENKQVFDLIFIDGTNIPHLLYTDCYLSWKLLNNRGLLIINNYSEEEDETIELLNIKGSYKNKRRVIEDFLEKYKLEYTLLHISNRIFLQKL
jgi:predicted O-methyltransferase YrrM